MANYNSTLQTNNTDLQAILNQINELPEAGGKDPVLQDKTVSPTTSQQTITADSGYDGLSKVTVSAMPIATQATPSITVNSSGLITATATQAAGYVAAGTKSATKQLAFQAAKTITPKATSQIAVSSGYYTGGNITVAGDSNLVAGNIKSGVSIFGVAGSYEGSSGGDTSMEDGIVTKSVTSYTNNRVTSVGSYVFYQCSKLTSINLPMVTYIDTSAFCQCYNLTSASLPMVSYIGGYAFYSCSKLTAANFPKLKKILTYAFEHCSALTTINCPMVTYVNNGAFLNCLNLTSINLPKLAIISNYVFQGCSKLTTVSFPAASMIGNATFMNCSRLSTLYLTASSVCALVNSNSFSNTSITRTTGSIFVPASLLASYKAATNWTYFSSRFVGI